MSAPSKLKKMNLFQDGLSFLAETKTVTTPKLTRLLEGWRGGGMSAEVDIDMGHEKLELEYTLGGLVPAAIRAWGRQAMYRFAGGYENSETGGVDAVEIVVRGTCVEVDMGDAETGKDTEHKFKVSCTFYQLTINGAEEIYLDVLNGIERVGGVDLTASLRRATGLL